MLISCGFGFGSRHFLRWLEAGWNPGLIASAKIWDSSQCVKEKAHPPGAGLGLCLVRAIPACTPGPGAESQKSKESEGR